MIRMTCVLNELNIDYLAEKLNFSTTFPEWESNPLPYVFRSHTLPTELSKAAKELGRIQTQTIFFRF